MRARGSTDSSGRRQLITIRGEGEEGAEREKGVVETRQDRGQQVKVRQEEDQLSSGLWALSQSMPRIMSCVPIEVT